MKRVTEMDAGTGKRFNFVVLKRLRRQEAHAFPALFAM